MIDGELRPFRMDWDGKNKMPQATHALGRESGETIINDGGD
jgi:hypothetical protein